MNIKSVFVVFLSALVAFKKKSLVILFVYLKSFFLKCQIVTFNSLSDSNGHDPSLWPWADESVAFTVQWLSIMTVTAMPLVISDYY